MTDSEFDEKLIKIDQMLMEKQVSVTDRLIVAWSYLTDARPLHVTARDPHFGPYEEPNLCHSVWDWYIKHYPDQATIGREWGRRLIIIRDQAFRVAIPVHFNPSAPLDAFENIENLTSSLRRLLDESETAYIQTTFNSYFWQASHLVMVWTAWCAPPRFGLASDLIHRGWQDLRDSCQTFTHRDPFAVLFTAQQGPEKFMKAMLLTHDPSLTEKHLRNRFGHSIPKLLQACTQIQPNFSQYASHVHLLDYGQEVRYRSQPKSIKEVVDIINLAHNICTEVGNYLLRERPTKVAQVTTVPKRFNLPQDVHKVPPDILANLFFENLDMAGEEFVQAKKEGKTDFVIVIDAIGTGLEELRKAKWKADADLAGNPPVRLFVSDRQRMCERLSQVSPDASIDLVEEPESTKPFLVLVMADNGLRVERLAEPRPLSSK